MRYQPITRLLYEPRTFFMLQASSKVAENTARVRMCQYKKPENVLFNNLLKTAITIGCKKKMAKLAEATKSTNLWRCCQCRSNNNKIATACMIFSITFKSMPA